MLLKSDLSKLFVKLNPVGAMGDCGCGQSGRGQSGRGQNGCGQNGHPKPLWSKRPNLCGQNGQIFVVKTAIVKCASILLHNIYKYAP